MQWNTLKQKTKTLINNSKSFYKIYLMKNIKTKPNTNKIEKWQQNLNNIDNYKTQGTIIRSKEKIIMKNNQQNSFNYKSNKNKQKNKSNH